MSGTPLVSVIIPLYDLAGYVAEAIESTLSQTLPADSVQTIVVDDGSTDGGARVAARYAPRVLLLEQANRGVAAARNTGLRAAKAPFVVFLDADDRLLHEKLAAQLAPFEARPEVDVVWSGVRYVDTAGRPLPPQGWARLEGDVFARLVLGNVGPPVAPMLRREALLAAGGFDERLRGAADWDLWLRVARSGGPWTTVDRALAEYRVRPEAMHQHPAAMAEDCRRVLDKLFADPTLSPPIAALAPLAYQQASLVAACDHYRAGDRDGGRRWLRDAVGRRPAVLAEPQSLRRICRLLLPVGSQSEARAVANWRWATALLRAMLTDLFSTEDLEPEVARLRVRAMLAYWQTVARFARKSAFAIAVGRAAPA